MSAAALASIPANFPLGSLYGDPRYSHTCYNMSDGADARGPWNEGQGPWNPGEHWEYVSNPREQIFQTEGLTKKQPVGTSKTIEDAPKYGKEIGKKRKEIMLERIGTGANQWSSYPQEDLSHPGSPTAKAGPNPTGT